MSLSARVASTRVTSGPQMAAFAALVYSAAAEEAGRGVPPNQQRALVQYMSAARGMPRGQEARMAPLFAKLRDAAGSMGAPQTSAAVVQAAAWFWRNVEQPGRARGVPVGRRGSQGAPVAPEAAPFQMPGWPAADGLSNADKALPWIIGIGGLGAVILILSS